jgi:hypothetical protein
MLTACGAIEYQSDLIKPAVASRAYLAGVGDTVLDLKQTQSLPNAFGRADLFGRTRDAGRVTVRFVGLDGNQAVFVRQDVAIQSNETTLTQGPQIVPGWVPPANAYSYPMQAGQLQLAAPVGGSMLVEGRRLNVLRSVDGAIEYSVD